MDIAAYMYGYCGNIHNIYIYIYGYIHADSMPDPGRRSWTARPSSERPRRPVDNI